MNNVTSAQIGTRLESVARTAAPVVVFVYVLGLTVGNWYMRITATLSAAHERWMSAPVIEQPPAPARPTVEKLCSAHTQRELMQMAGTRSKRSKRELARLILAAA